MIGLQRKHLPPGLGTTIGRARLLYPGLVAVVDLAAWIPGFWIAGLVRSELGALSIRWTRIFAIALVGAVVFAIGAIGSRLYSGKWRAATFEEVVGLAISWLPAAGAAILINGAFLTPRVPTSVVAFGALVALMTSLVARVVWRFCREALNRPDPGGRNRVLVIGAGTAGSSVVQSMQTDPDSTHVAVAVLDDDPRKRDRVIHGVPVLGDRHDVSKLAGQADTMVIAIPSAGASDIDELTAIGTENGLEVRVLPSVGEMIGMLASIDHARPVEIGDLLGRDEVTMDREAVADYVTGRRVLVTGAGGSIGSELCRQLSSFDPAQLIMLDRDETGLQEVQLSIAGHGLLDDPGLVLADIRDRDRVGQIFAEMQPEIVFHAAALKHLPLLESHPREGLLTNVCGSRNVLEAARDHDVALFVNVSTDKAATPSSVLGTTKRLAEMFTSAIGRTAKGRFVSVRFGNVLASRGSVVPTFERQIRAGGPVTVTHREATRYFMTIPEAVRLILQAGAFGSTGEVMVLDMGEPMLILDLARKLIRHHRSEAEVVFTGLRPNEKLHEVLSSDNEDLVPGPHERIMHAVLPAPSLEAIDLDTLLATPSPDLADRLMVACARSEATVLSGAASVAGMADQPDG